MFLIGVNMTSIRAPLAVHTLISDVHFKFYRKNKFLFFQCVERKREREREYIDVDLFIDH